MGEGDIFLNLPQKWKVRRMAFMAVPEGVIEAGQSLLNDQTFPMIPLN